MQITFRSLVEDQPSHAAMAVFKEGWPGWRAWARARPRPDAPDLAESRRALEHHMPEMARIWSRFVAATGADEEAAGFLTFWKPPRFLGGCSQAAIGGPAPVLLRNYDLDPRLSEATVLASRYGAHRVMGMVDGILGLADGINEPGLAVSLAYGGSGRTGPGFGVPVVVRYLLEVCGSVVEGIEALRAIPHHMAYNITMVDRTGARATVFISPEGARLADRPYATNHQERVSDPAHAAFSRSEERLAHLDTLFAAPGLDTEKLQGAFLAAPLAADRFRQGFGTVYTARYDPLGATLELRWRDQAPWIHDLAAPREETRRVRYDRFGQEDANADWLRFVPEPQRAQLARWIGDAPVA